MGPPTGGNTGTKSSPYLCKESQISSAPSNRSLAANSIGPDRPTHSQPLLIYIYIYSSHATTLWSSLSPSGVAACRYQWDKYRIQVLKNWGCEPLCLLSAEMYPEDKPLSKALIKQMAELSDLVSVNEGRDLLLSEIYLRSQGDRRHGKLSYHKDLILSDLTEAIKKAKTPMVSQQKRLLDSAPDQTSDETSDQTQQDRSHKKRSLGL